MDCGVDSATCASRDSETPGTGGSLWEREVRTTGQAGALRAGRGGVGRGEAGRGGVAFLRHLVAGRWEHLSMRGLRRMRGAVNMRSRVPTEPSGSQISEEGGSMCAVLPGRSECAIGLL